jgi:hypothetical protein
MAKYTIYLPLDQTQSFPVGTIFEKHMYVTDVIAYELKKQLYLMGHKVDIAYVPLNSLDGKRLCIDELGIDVTNHIPISSSLWMLVANNDTNKFSIIDLQDSPGITVILQRHHNFVVSLVGQFSLERYYNENKDLDYTKLIPFNYFAYYPNMVESMVEEIQDIRSSSTLDDRVFFLGNNKEDYVHRGRRIREVISSLEYLYPDEVRVGSWEKKLPPEEFWKEAAKHTISLGLPGHQWCSREHELWTLGLPVMLYEHTHHMGVELIPNYHYIAVPVGKRLSIGMADNPEEAAHQIMKTHRKWVNPENRWRLDNIARNGQIRMMKHASPRACVPKMIELLQLGYW